jgi:RNA polymerase sigma-70 factor (ECF subfamily)
VFTTHAGQVWRAVLVTTAGRREIADEATYEAFARLLDHREGVRDPAAWVFRTAYRLASDELRREAAISGEAETASLGGDEGSSLPAGLTAALATLPPEQRLAVFLHYYADLPVREVARLSGAPVATVKVRLHRARKALAARLDLVEVRDV